MAKFRIVAATTIVGILSQELPSDGFAHYDYRGPAKEPEVDAEDCDFCGYVTRTKAGPNVPSLWTMRVSKREPAVHEVGDPASRPETLSYSFFSSASRLLWFFPSTMLFMERGDLDAFLEVCRFNGITYHVHHYDGEIAVTRPSRTSIAA